MGGKMAGYWDIDEDWAANTYAIEVQQPWSRKLMNREKIVETRTYPYPQALLGKDVLLAETQEGKAGQSAVGDVVAAGDPALRVIGTVVVKECVVYVSQEQWDNDRKRHLVPADNPYGFKDTPDKVFYGWVVDRPRPLAASQPIPALTRTKRSIFRCEPSDAAGAGRARGDKRSPLAWVWQLACLALALWGNYVRWCSMEPRNLPQERELGLLVYLTVQTWAWSAVYHALSTVEAAAGGRGSSLTAVVYGMSHFVNTMQAAAFVGFYLFVLPHLEIPLTWQLHATHATFAALIWLDVAHAKHRPTLAARLPSRAAASLGVAGYAACYAVLVGVNFARVGAWPYRFMDKWASIPQQVALQSVLMCWNVALGLAVHQLMRTVAGPAKPKRA